MREFTFSCGDSVLCWEVSCEPLSEESVGRMMGDESGEPEPESEDVEVEEWSGVARLLVVGGSRSEARGFPVCRLAIAQPAASAALRRQGLQTRAALKQQHLLDRGERRDVE